MRLIDADALKEFINNGRVCDICPNKKLNCAIYCDFPDSLTPLLEKVIDNAPTVTIKEWKEEMPIYIKDAMLEALRPQEEKEHKERIFNPFDHRTIGEI